MVSANSVIPADFLLSISYGVSFAIAAIAGYKILQREDITIDRQFYVGITSLIFLAGLASSQLLHKGVPIYLILPAVAGGSLVAFLGSKRLETSDFRYWKILLLLGFAGTLPLLYSFSPDTSSIFRLSGVTAVWLLPYLLLVKVSDIFGRKEVFLPIGAHLMDASTTFTALGSGGTEKVFFTRVVMDVLGDWAIFLVKGSIVIPVTLYIYSTDIEDFRKKYYLFLIYALGLGLAAHNIGIIFW